MFLLRQKCIIMNPTSAMTNNYASASAKQYKKDLMHVSDKEARKFLFKNGYFASSFILPEYYVPSGFDKISLTPINWTIKPLDIKVTQTLDIFTPKNFLSWRNFNFLNPYIFIHIVNELTEFTNWKAIKSLLTQDNIINNFSIPIFKLKRNETLSGKSILNWLQMAERDLIKDCSDYNYLITTDIKDFYPSIYTHSIGWAINTKNTLKISKNRKEYSYLGNRIDKLFQNCHDTQTNGIPVSSLVSDIIAELILADVDNKISNEISKKEIKDVFISRYRDDYRIMSKDEVSGKITLQLLSRILQTEYNLYLNTDKTNSYNDIIEGSLRPWMTCIKESNILRDIYYEEFPSKINGNYIKDSLIAIYRIQKSNISSRISTTMISKLSDHLYNNMSEVDITPEKILEVISILRKISLFREDVTPQVFLLLDILLSKIIKTTDRKRILLSLKESIIGKDDQEYQLIWLYRLCLSKMPSECPKILSKYNLPLLRVVDRGYYKYDFDIFHPIDKLSTNDTAELKKFKLIDRKKIKQITGVAINPSSLKVFGY